MSLTHSPEWCVGVFASGLVTFENLEEGEPMHMRGLSRQEILDMWQKPRPVARLTHSVHFPWKPGYGGAAAE